jgi:glycosyltransferase involved in cell wall biosynthesis
MGAAHVSIAPLEAPQTRSLSVGLVYRHFNHSGSLHQFQVELARGLSRRGHDVHVFALESTCDESLAPDCTFHYVPVDHENELTSFAENAYALVGKARHALDVVHARIPSTWGGDIVHVHAVARAEARRRGTSTARWMAAQLRHRDNATRLRLEQRAITFPGTQIFHAETQQVAIDLQDEYGIDESRIRVALPGVDLERFHPAAKDTARRRLGLPAEGGIALFCGHDFERKGLARAIEATACASSPLTLVVVGGGDDQRYRALAAKLAVTERVVFFGTRSDTHLFFQAADVFVLPTDHDVWGVTAIEAMACGTPPVVYETAGVAQAITSGANGIVLRASADSRELAHTLDALLGFHARRDAMGVAASAVARQHSWEKNLDVVESDLFRLGPRGRNPVAC